MDLDRLDHLLGRVVLFDLGQQGESRMTRWKAYCFLLSGFDLELREVLLYDMSQSDGTIGGSEDIFDHATLTPLHRPTISIDFVRVCK